MAKKPPEGFNTPFRELKAATQAQSKAAAAAAQIPAPKAAPAAAPTTRAAPSPTPSHPTPGPGRGAEEQKLFEQAMRGVVPLSRSDRTRRAASVPDAAPSRAASAARSRREDALADADLAELVAGRGKLTVDEAGEVMSGRAAGIDRRLLRRLRDGEFAIDVQIDLHGMSREQAVSALERTLRRACTDGRRAVLVIHGRGLNSGTLGPVLKEAVKRALCEGPCARLVLAFTSAPPAQGGPGATVVLLRKQQR
ncbi:MAG TPA: Smr/MutS family protein [Polyangia bacterium]|jgi:DNA-nicking Smr family endonuclease|nr:Smr/MutS family protein [Polyangia bacterium]